MGMLDGKKIAIVATDGFEYSELTEPKRALEEEGAAVDVLAPQGAEITGETKGERAGAVTVDKLLKDARGEDYDGLVLPGGVKNPDRLRVDEGALTFVHHFVASEKPIASICHGPWTLINAQGVAGKRVTSWPSLQMDLKNAGAEWVDEEVVRDGKLVTSRKPEDIPAFSREAIALFSER